MSLRERYNAVIRKLNQLSPIYDELSEDEEVTEEDCEYMESHWRGCVKPALARARWKSLEQNFSKKEG